MSQPDENNKQSNNKSRKRYRTLVIDGVRYRTQLNEKFKNRKKWDHLDKGNIYSEFPGTVLKVDVSEGDYVNKGDRLYIYDAMKMKNQAYSDIEGTLKNIRIKENDVIRKGQLLFVIE